MPKAQGWLSRHRRLAHCEARTLRLTRVNATSYGELFCSETVERAFAEHCAAGRRTIIAGSSVPVWKLVEVTPKVMRIRKRFLDPHERKRQSRKMEAA
jgi:hypothetical protein